MDATVTSMSAVMFLVGMAVAFGIAYVVATGRARRHAAAITHERREAEDRLRDFAEVSSDWFWEMNEDLRFTHFSGHILEALGFDGSHYLGRTRREIAADAGDEAHWQGHLETLDSHLPFHDFRYDLRLPDGKALLISISGRPVFDDDGRFLGYRGTGRDLTAETQIRSALGDSEERLRETRERLDIVAANLPIAIYRAVRGANGMMTFPYLSAGIRKFVGFEADEIKRNPALMESTVHGDDRAHLQAAVETASEMMTPLNCTYRRVMPSGGTHWVRTMARSHQARHDEVTWDGVIIDITGQVMAEQAQKKLEETMATALESLQEGFALFDRSHRLVVANEEYLRVAPMADKILEARGTYKDLVRAAVNAGLFDLEGGNPEAFVAKRLQAHRQPGDPHVVKHWNDHWYMLKEARMSDGGTAVTVVDITPLKLAESAARMAKEEAEFASRSKSEFLANMSHELRTPLNSVIGMSDVIMSKSFGKLDNATYKEYAADINASGRHLLSVISDILDIARIEAREILLEESDTDLDEVLSDCECMVRDRARQAGLGLEIAIDEGARYLFADTRRLRQIILNLLSNDIKFTPTGGRIAVGTARDAADRLEITVSDTGIGIAPDDVPRILEPFRQFEDIMTHPHEGSGLGLSLVKLLTEAHGGTLTIKSRIGERASAVLSFPASRISPVPANDSVASTSSAARGGAGE